MFEMKKNRYVFFLMVYWKGEQLNQRHDELRFRYVKLGYGKRSKRRTARITRLECSLEIWTRDQDLEIISLNMIIEAMDIDKFVERED